MGEREIGTVEGWTFMFLMESKMGCRVDVRGRDIVRLFSFISFEAK